MSKKALMALFVLLFGTLLLIAGCGGGGGGSSPSSDTTIQNLFNTPADHFDNALNTAMSKAQLPGPNLAPQGSSPLPANSIANSTCSYSVSGDTTDADADGFPVDATYTFNCSYSSTQAPVDVNGKVHVSDQDDSDPLSGFLIETPRPEFITYKMGTITSIHDFLDNLTLSNNSYTFNPWFHNIDIAPLPPDDNCSFMTDWSGRT